jgi:hypothetical protein
MPLRGRWGGGKWHASCGPEWRLSAVAAVPLRGQSRWAQQHLHMQVCDIGPANETSRAQSGPLRST